MMSMAKVSAFASAQQAAQYGKELEKAGFEATVSGPVDLVLIDKPGSSVDGWAESGKTWYVVIGSQAKFTPVP